MAEIMDVAREVMRERGSERFLTAEVASRCGISEGTIYKYFESRRDLLIRVAEKWFDEFLVEEHPLDRKLPFRERLLQVIRRHLSIIRAEPSLARFMLADLRADPNYRTTDMHKLSRQNARSITNIIRDGIEQGDVRPDVNVRIVRNLIQGCIEYQVWSFLRGEGDFSVEHSAQGITEIIVHGIGAAHPVPEMGLQDTVARLDAIADRISAKLDAA